MNAKTFRKEVLAKWEECETCPVCYFRCEPPFKKCRNGHLTCEICLQSLTKCSTCRCPSLRMINDTVLESLHETLCLPPTGRRKYSLKKPNSMAPELPAEGQDPYGLAALSILQLNKRIRLAETVIYMGTFVAAKSCNMEGHDVNLTLEESTYTERFILHKRIKGEHEAVDALPFTLKHGSFQKNCIQKFDEKSGCNDLHNSAKESFVDNNYPISLEIEGNSRKYTQLRKAEDVFDYDGFIDPALLQVTNQEEGMTLHISEKIRVQYERHTSLILDPKLKPCIVKNSADGRFKFDLYSESFRTNGSMKTHSSKAQSKLQSFTSATSVISIESA
ncbi:unnamed protein product [Bemisia tabaci]|uniref:E3 ubiquitin-protein ligase Sina-like RING finger domain-containing protein n=1 Tax=Bemisia tabaci TaxID=7038 RepID=A0A9P0AHX7_BEMTA|nr:unnamed protein product [Bemisia tabaci]